MGIMVMAMVEVTLTLYASFRKAILKSLPIVTGLVEIISFASLQSFRKAKAVYSVKWYKKYRQR